MIVVPVPKLHTSGLKGRLQGSRRARSVKYSVIIRVIYFLKIDIWAGFQSARSLIPRLIQSRSHPKRRDISESELDRIRI